MTAQELIARQVEEAGAMLHRLVDGLDATHADSKSGSLMPAQEQVRHLCVCYLACLDAAAGKTPTWDYHVAEVPWTDSLTKMWSLRGQAVEALSGHDDDSVQNASMYIVAHDNYHIGQLSSLRIALDPSWDPYSIYG